MVARMKKKTAKRASLAAFDALCRAGLNGKRAEAIAGAVMAALHEYDKGEKQQPQTTPQEAA
jgi:hypothetical protein